MAKIGKQAAARRTAAADVALEGGFVLATLVEYLAQRVVNEVWIVEMTRGTYRVEALLTWKPGRCPLVAARGRLRTFRSLDTVARFLHQIGCGKTSIRMELTS